MRIAIRTGIFVFFVALSASVAGDPPLKAARKSPFTEPPKSPLSGIGRTSRTRDFFNLDGNKFTPSNYDPFKVSMNPSAGIRGFKTEDDDLIEAMAPVTYIGPMLDMTLRGPGRATPWGYEKGPRIPGEKIVNTTFKMDLDPNWSIRTGVNMTGWYADGIDARVTESMLKFRPGEVFDYTGYSTVIGFERRVGKRAQFSLMYGTKPGANGVQLYNPTRDSQQLRVSAKITF